MTASASVTLASLSDQLADTVARAARAVVSVHARPRMPSTGVHWRDGLVVTTEATVRRDEGITLTLPDGQSLAATLAGRDPGTDLAVLKLDPGRLAVADLGDPASLRPGHLVLALARLGDLEPRVAFGAVSATGGRWRSWKGGEIDLWLQSDLTLPPGFGGGPLVDAQGRIVGINSGGLSRPLATTIPISTVERVLGQLLERGYVARGWLGAAMQPVRLDAAVRERLGLEREVGLIVLSVEPGGPAAAAGFLVGDILLELHGRRVEHPDAVLEVLGGDVVGRSVRAELVRGGVQREVEVTISERPRRRS